MSVPEIGNFRGMITWRGVDGDRLEQVRLQLNDKRVKAYGRIISAATASTPAFSASYDLVTNDAGVTRRLSVHVVRESGDMQLSVSRDRDGTWLVQSPNGVTRSDFGGALDIDVALSPLFNTLHVRRVGLRSDVAVAPTPVPMVYLDLPSGDVSGVTQQYSVADGKVRFEGMGTTADITVDEYGIVVDYPNLATRL